MDRDHNPNDYVCVFGSASNNIDPKYKAAVHELGEKLAEAGFSLIFGGGDEGLMGAVARGVRSKGGRVIGVTPQIIDAVQKRYDCDEFIATESISERIDIMEALSCAFIVVPGGIGTLDELFYAMARNHVHELNDPICVLNVDGFYDKLLEMLNDMHRGGFITAPDYAHVALFEDVDALVAKLAERRQ